MYNFGKNVNESSADDVGMIHSWNNEIIKLTGRYFIFMFLHQLTSRVDNDFLEFSRNDFDR